MRGRRSVLRRRSGRRGGVSQGRRVGGQWEWRRGREGGEGRGGGGGGVNREETRSTRIVLMHLHGFVGMYICGKQWVKYMRLGLFVGF